MTLAHVVAVRNTNIVAVGMNNNKIRKVVKLNNANVREK